MVPLWQANNALWCKYSLQSIKPSVNHAQLRTPHPHPPMERQLEVISEQQLRNNELIVVQKDFLLNEFVPRCEKIGMNKRHIEALVPKFFIGLGDIYRKTDITQEHFLASLSDICDNLLHHADNHKYFLSNKEGRDVGWDTTIKSIADVRIPSEVQVDAAEARAYHDVYFPVAREKGEKVGSGREGRRIRSVINLTSAEDEYIVDAVNLTDLTEKFKARMGGVLVR
jgi:hypothetical protein